MIKLKDILNESKYLKREFGEPLPTFKGVMEKHQMEKLTEYWWDDLSDEEQTAYIKKHGEEPKRRGDTKSSEKKKENWWDEMSDKHKKLFIKKYGKPPGIATKSKEKKDPDEPDTDKSWGVFFRGGSIGDSGGTTLPEQGGIILKATFDSQDEAKGYAKRRNKRLSSGEKKYYKMRYLVRDLDKKRSQLKRH